MNKKKNTFPVGLVGRFCAAVVLLLLGGMTVSAENGDFGINRLSISKEAGLTINPGQQKKIAIELTNDAAIGSLQFDLSLPDGLEFEGDTKPSMIEKDLERMTRNSHQVMCVKQEQLSGYGRTVYRMGLLFVGSDMKNAAIKGNSGAILYLTVKAASYFRGGDITFEPNSAYGSVAVTGDDGKVTDVSVALDCEDARMSLHVGTVALDHTGELPLWAGGDTQDICVMVQNDIELTSLQADLVLPEGVVLDTDADGEYIFGIGEYGRLSENVQVLAKQNTGFYRIVVSSLTNDVFGGNDGALFSFRLKTTDGFADAGEVKLSNVIVSGVGGVVSNMLDGAPTFTVTPLTDITGDGEWTVDDLQEWIDEAFIGKSEARKYDINRDGMVEVDDLDAIIGLIMSPAAAGE